MQATKSVNENEATKVSMLLNLIGSQGTELYESFTWTGDDEAERKLDEVVAKFDEHVGKHENVKYESV